MIQSNEMFNRFSQQLCENLDECEIVSEIPDCNEIIRNNPEPEPLDETTNRNYYTIVKRDTFRQQHVAVKSNANMKIKVYTKISKGLGLWNRSLSRAENMEIVRKELRTYQTNDRLRHQLHALRINVKHLNLEENLLCRSGSILKKNVCGKFNESNARTKATNTSTENNCMFVVMFSSMPKRNIP